jgi:hypothetical protein
VTPVLAIALAGLSCPRDPAKSLVDGSWLAEPQTATVEQLVSLPPPRWWSPWRRRERRVAVIDVEFLAAKDEADGDLHVVVSGRSGLTMIVEFPSPACTWGSRYKFRMQRALLRFLQLLREGVSRFRFTGVIYFDRPHNQTGVAPNGVELHPVLGVEPLR